MMLSLLVGCARLISTTFTGTNKVNLTIAPLSDGYGINEGITFLSDSDKYILDFGLKENSSRLSIYKDASGYMNFECLISTIECTW